MWYTMEKKLKLHYCSVFNSPYFKKNMAEDNRQKKINPIFSGICFNFIGDFYLNRILKRNTQKNTLIQAKEHLLREVCF